MHSLQPKARRCWGQRRQASFTARRRDAERCPRATAGAALHSAGTARAERGQGWVDVPAAHCCGSLTPSSLSSPLGCPHPRGSSVPVVGPTNPRSVRAQSPVRGLAGAAACAEVSCGEHCCPPCRERGLPPSLERGGTRLGHGDPSLPWTCAQALLQTLEGRSARSRRADTAAIRKVIVLLQLCQGV